MLVEGHTFETFVRNYSVMKNVEIVGEAAYMLSKAFKKTHPSTPWKIVQGMRHVLVHDYATIDDKELYNTAVNGIPELRQQVERYLADIDWYAWKALPDDFEDTADETALKLARQMKADGMPAENISRYTGLTADEIAKL